MYTMSQPAIMICLTLLMGSHENVRAYIGCFSTEGCDPVSLVNASSAEECCLGPGFYYSDGTNCTQCIVFGWHQQNLEGPEFMFAYTVEIGYKKGDGNLLGVFFTLHPSHASPTAGLSDVTFDLQASIPPLRQGFGISRVHVSFVDDDIAQEGYEHAVLRMSLNSTSIPPAGSFIDSDLELTIYDMDMVTMELDQDTYRSNEADGSMHVNVRKSLALANPVFVTIIPWTVEQAECYPVNVPIEFFSKSAKYSLHLTVIPRSTFVCRHNRSHSVYSNCTSHKPQFTYDSSEPLNRRDFSPEVITIYFPADEMNSVPDNSVRASIDLVDDSIDEADQEYFVIALKIANATDKFKINQFGSERTVSLGVISDNDDIVIGFEYDEYTFHEPPFETEAGQNVALVKNAITEQTYSFVLRAESLVPNATFAAAEMYQDYSLTTFSNEFEFPPDQQHLQIFNNSGPWFGFAVFSLSADSHPEGPEAFQLTINPTNREAAPRFSLPTQGSGIFKSTLMIIIDDENITIGWENKSLTIPEDVGLFEVCYSVLVSLPIDPIYPEAEQTVRMLVDTMSDSADENDYMPLRSRDFDVERTLDAYNNTQRACIPLTIKSDDAYEGPETFSVTLISPDSDTLNYLFIAPSVTSITISDTTDLTIGFIGAPYVVMENTGPVIFIVGVIGDTELQTDVVVSFSTMNGSTSGRTAVDGPDYVGRYNVLLTFNASTRAVEVPVDLIDDFEFEGDEDFNAILTLVNGERLTLSQDRAVATVVDNNETVCQSLELTLENGYIQYSPDTSSPYLEGTKASHICNYGFVLNGNGIRVCQNDSFFDGVAPICEPIECKPLPEILNGRFTFAKDIVPNYELGTTATYKCDDGFFLIGEDQRNCTPGNGSSVFGVFDSQQPICVPDCGNPFKPDNGQVTFNKTLSGSEASYSCDHGYRLDGNAVISCQENSSWPQSPVCLIQDCLIPSAPINGTVEIVSGTVFESIANVSCADGFSLVGNTTIVCQADGTWSDLPMCLADCEGLSVLNNGWIEPVGVPLKYNTTATYSCNPGFEPEANVTIRCEANGTWSHLPFCQVECGPPDNPANGQVTLEVLEAVYTCNPGYSLNGDNHRSCQSNKVWSGAQPFCMNIATIVGSVAAVFFCLLIVIIVLSVLVCWVHQYLKKELEPPTKGEDSIEFCRINSSLGREYESKRKESAMFQSQIREVVAMIPRHLRIPRSCLKMSNTSIGQGEFGIVYKGVLIGWNDTPVQAVAVKALKGLFTLKDVQSMVDEITKMLEFNYPHVLSLIGVCLDTGPGVSMVMPFMANGSLKDYLKRERSNFEITDQNSDKILEARRLLLRMCYQIALGMEYLTQQKFIHRDLAARNCMLDSDGSIKVGDFGLAEDVYSCGYFRQEGKNIKLPYKWMALESLTDSIFTEKTDVWSYGVTMWEIFTGGQNPYPAVDSMSLPQLLKNGQRLDTPQNTACSPEIFSVMARCWCDDPEERPGFSELCSIMDLQLSLVSDYTELRMVLVQEQPDIHVYDVVAEDELSETDDQNGQENSQSDL